jgi:hypothetical protein
MRSLLYHAIANFYTIFCGQQAISVMVKRQAYLYIYKNDTFVGQSGKPSGFPSTF